MEVIMVITFNIISRAVTNRRLRKTIRDAIKSETDEEIIEPPHKMHFDHIKKQCVISKVSGSDIGADELLTALIPYEVLEKMLDGDWSDLTGIKYI